MLKKGFKDEEQKKTDQILNAGLQLAFVPETWKLEEKKKLDEILLNAADLSLDDITRLPKDKLLEILKAHKFSFSNLERFADILLKIFPVEPKNRTNHAQKALAVYEYAQKESKTYSFDLIQKMEDAKKEI